MTVGEHFTCSPTVINFDNHSIYLEDGTETLQDIGRVAAGVKR